MFQYAFSKFLESIGKTDVVLEFGFYQYIQQQGGDSIREPLLDRFHCEYRTPEEPMPVPGHIVTEGELMQGIFLDDVIFIGDWQDRELVCRSEELLRRDFRLRNEYITPELQTLAEEMLKDEHSVSVHIRRTDYLNPDNREKYVQLEAGYYVNALNTIADRIGKKPTVYLFSDDPAGAVRMIGNSCGDICAVEGNAAYQDLYLMTMAHHSIIANSTFSWWGSFLRERRDGITVVPKRWFRHRPDYMLYAETDIRL
ncbi:MAG: alpha-1,2-fucosyltransferase [Lachnospiraceae bacterium]|nr:alpha-1,2-fucosyltransferase [Lachnospiraceae bacterium]